jgi:spectinomycin phosphotransferase
MTEEGTKYFLKLKKHFAEISVEVPLFLKSRGIAAVMSPHQTKSKQYRVDVGEYKMILYPFVEGKNGFEMELSASHKHRLGAALKSIHSTPVPPRLESILPKEGFAPHYRERVRSFQARAEQISCHDALAAKLASFIKTRSKEIGHLVARTEELAAKLRSEPPEPVLCHSDVHGRNILIGEAGELYIVDWDEPILAPKERDLMFVGGGIDRIWRSELDEHIFYEGYGETSIHLSALAYYRYERIIEDLAAYGEQLLSSEGSVTNRERLYQYFTSNFESSTRMEIAKKTDELLASASRAD